MVKKVYLALVIGVLGPLTLSFEASEINNKNIPVYTDVKDSDYDLEYINFSSKNFFVALLSISLCNLGIIDECLLLFLPCVCIANSLYFKALFESVGIDLANT